LVNLLASLRANQRKQKENLIGDLHGMQAAGVQIPLAPLKLCDVMILFVHFFIGNHR
tara:strand:+ start:137 stop:307 length:171 start_codon:yes stop_codon:yes gene_type:complete